MRRPLRGAIYARFSTKDQHSIEDQVRACREFAERNGITVAEEHVFADRATRGCRSRRAGLQGLQQALEKDEVDVVLVFTTNRLFRKTYKSLGFVEEEIVDRGKRCVFVKSGVDTADTDRWRQLLQMHAMMDEFVVQMSGEHVRAAHEGLMDRDLVWGTLSFGYSGVPVPGETTKRNRSRRRIEVDPDAAQWVRKIFEWYVDLRLSIAGIVRRLNREHAPLPPRTTIGRWTRQAVRLVLSNPRYRGVWEYGRTQAVYLNRQDYVRQIPREKPLKVKNIARLRIIDDVIWHGAQARLQNEPRGQHRHSNKSGRPVGAGLLNGMLFCQTDRRALRVGGTNGRYYACPVCTQSDQPALVTYLNRKLAVQVITKECADLIKGDADLVDRVVQYCQAYAESAQRLDPLRLAELKSREARLTARIAFILENPGESEADQSENAQALKQVRAERSRLQAELASQEAATSRPAHVPERHEVEALLDGLAATLQRAGDSDDEDQVAAVRRVIEIITGGRILVTQAGERVAKRGWLRGSFRTRLFAHLVAEVTGSPAPEGDGRELCVEFRMPTRAEGLADQVKGLRDEGLRMQDIAAELGCHRNLVKKALDHWYTRQGQTPPDGRSLRSLLKREGQTAPRFQRIATQVKALADQGMLLQEIAKRLRCDRNEVTKAMRFACEQAGEPCVDGRTRRRSLARKTSGPCRRRSA